MRNLVPSLLLLLGVTLPGGPIRADSTGAKASGAERTRAKSAPKTCRQDADCTLTEWSCSPCGVCPGFPPYAIDKRTLRRQVARCEYEGARGGRRRAAVTCGACEAPPPWRVTNPLRCEAGRCTVDIQELDPQGTRQASSSPPPSGSPPDDAAEPNGF